MQADCPPGGDVPGQRIPSLVLLPPGVSRRGPEGGSLDEARRRTVTGLRSALVLSLTLTAALLGYFSYTILLTNQIHQVRCSLQMMPPRRKA